MSLLPESLITARFRLNPIQQKALGKLGLKTLEDLLRYLPTRYGTAGIARKIAELKVGDEAIIYAQVLKNQTKKAWRKKIPMAEAIVEDETGKIKIIWFHQAYLAKKAPAGTSAYFAGKVTERQGELYLANPEIDLSGVPNKKVAAGESLFANSETESPTPVYPETRGLSSGWFYHHLKTILSEGTQEELVDPIPAEILTTFNLPKLATALVWVHTPKRRSDAEAARKRFAFEEIFFIQLARLRDRAEYQAQGAQKLEVENEKLEEFLKRFPFPLTKAQTRAIEQILVDFKLGRPMTRLLEGDVGSGKTAVAAATAYAAVAAGGECAYMAPTEILAKQHFASFIDYFKHLPVNIGLITGSGCYKFPSKISSGPSTTLGVNYTSISRPQLLKWVANGEIPILIGTHALIQKTVKWKNLAYVIIDEQHRFGVMQRAKLAQKNNNLVYPERSRGAPHLLSMTATPIPRTLALTIYGDLDLSLLDELPVGRKSIITKIIPPSDEERQKVYEFLRQEIKAGRQAYVICPRIDEPDPNKELALQARSAKAELKKLGESIFPEFMVGLIHSKMKPADKEEVMASFTAGKIDILVATSVVEVGVNVPNATSIIIEGAERFGLAQLHQLRGRVFRSSHQAYCYLFTDTKGEKTAHRLKALATAKNGFELAELDLALRGAGGLTGGKQWGISDLGMEAIKNLKLVEAARASAQKIIATLDRYPQTKTALDARPRAVHLE
ncbi:MAG: ATP-dependent DNA helicase RecG [bacterium]|nr:ATP-dependent DNA helicase RecG [bacterium]